MLKSMWYASLDKLLSIVNLWLGNLDYDDNGIVVSISSIVIKQVLTSPDKISPSHWFCSETLYPWILITCTEYSPSSMQTVLVSGVWIAWNEGVDVFPAMFIVKSDARFVPPLSLIIFVVKTRYPGWDCFSINGICFVAIFLRLELGLVLVSEDYQGLW